MDIEIQGMTPLISVFDMPASLRFYRDVLGFEVSRGINLDPPELAHYGMKQLYVNDPYNYNLCFQSQADA